MTFNKKKISPRRQQLIIKVTCLHFHYYLDESCLSVHRNQIAGKLFFRYSFTFLTTENIFIIHNKTGFFFYLENKSKDIQQKPEQNNVVPELNRASTDSVSVGGGVVRPVRSWGGQDYNVTKNISGLTSVMGSWSRVKVKWIATRLITKAQEKWPGSQWSEHHGQLSSPFKTASWPDQQQSPRILSSLRSKYCFTMKDLCLIHKESSADKLDGWFLAQELMPWFCPCLGPCHGSEWGSCSVFFLNNKEAHPKNECTENSDKIRKYRKLKKSQLWIIDKRNSEEKDKSKHFSAFKIWSLQQRGALSLFIMTQDLFNIMPLCKEPIDCNVWEG